MRRVSWVLCAVMFVACGTETATPEWDEEDGEYAGGDAEPTHPGDDGAPTGDPEPGDSQPAPDDEPEPEPEPEPTPGPFTLALSVSPAGTGTLTASPNRATYPDGMSVTLTATPSTGYSLVGLSGAVQSTQPSTLLVMHADAQVTATFALRSYTLTVTSSAGGTVTRAPIQSTYEHGSEVTLSAEPSLGYRFVGWEGDAAGNDDPLALVMDDDKTVHAVFERIPVTLTLVTTPTTGGTLTASPAGPYFHGDTVTLTATAASAHQFKALSGGVTSTTSPTQLTLTTNTTVTASFVTVPVIAAPGSVIGPTPYTVSWTYIWPLGTVTSNDRYELEESSTSASSGFSVIYSSPTNQRPESGSRSLTRAPGTFYYRVRARNSEAFSPYSQVVTVVRQPGPKRLRIINDLPGGVDGWGNDWSSLNSISRVRIATTQAAVQNGTGEQMGTSDIVCGSGSTSSISPGSSRNFDTANMPSTYYVFIAAAQWQPYGFNGCWERKNSRVFACNGECCAEKWQVIIVSSHSYDTEELRVSDFLPATHWEGTDFCG